MQTAMQLPWATSKPSRPMFAGFEGSNGPADSLFTPNLDHSDHGDGSMLVAPREQSLAALDDDAAVSHHAPLLESSLAPSPTIAMEAATADAPSAPVDMPPAAAVDHLPPLVADDPVLLDPLTTSALDAAPVVPTAMPMSMPMSMSLPMSMPALDTPISLPTDMHMDPMVAMGPIDDFAMMHAGLNGYGSIAPPAESEQRLSAFARLRFDDGSYYMHTYQIFLGRNVDLAHKDMRRLAKVDQLRAKGEQQRAQALLNNGSRKRKRDGARSVISEAGGIVNAPMEMMPMAYQQRRQSIASQSLSSNSQQQVDGQPPSHAPQELLMQAFPEAPDQLENQVSEDPNDCPLVPIHPQHITDRTGLRGPKGISRQHAKIFYDFDNGHFCLAVMGSNGLYHEDTFLPKGACVELNHGETITIGMVEMSFFLPDIALTEEQRNRQESGSHSRPMSFSFENGRGESEDLDDSASEDLSVNPRHVYHYPVGSDLESEDDVVGEDEDLDLDDDDEDQYSPAPRRPKPSLKLKLKNKKKKHHVPPPKLSKLNHKRKAIREPSPEEPPPTKKAKPKVKETQKEPLKEKEKEKGKAAKIPAKQPTKAPVHESPKEISPPKETVEPVQVIKPESPVAVRRISEVRIEGMEDGDNEGMITAEIARRHNLPESLIGTPLAKRKGPGRPPKDGVMSKRQRSQLIKQGKEIEKARAAGIDPADLPQPTVKPKIVRRKESNAGEDEDVRETTEKSDGLGTPGEKKHTKPAKPARTPSPEMRIEDYTEEQLQRPTSNYVVLIHEAISSATTGQMNLQQIYNYIEKSYPWYKFKTTTSGWQSSVRHNLGQHDAFVKGDKEGKGYMWRINPSVSIEKERRKRQVSPPQVNHAQRPGYYPPPSAYPPLYGQPGFYPGMPPQSMPPNAQPRPPPSVEPVQPRLPPSMARNAPAAAAASSNAPAPTPYASPWASGNPMGTPPTQHPPRPYPPSSSQTPPVTSAGASSGQYGVLYPTSAPQTSYSNYSTSSPYANHHATAGPSPYSTTPGRPYAPYPPPVPPAAPSTPGLIAQHPHAPQTQPQAPQNDASGTPHPSGRYPTSTSPDLIRQLEAFRTVYLQTRIEAGEDKKVDNAIRAYVSPNLVSTLTPPEESLLVAIKTIPTLNQFRGGPEPTNAEEGVQANGTAATVNGSSKDAVPAATAAAIAADAAANTVPRAQSSLTNEPQKFAPNMTGPSAGTGATVAPGTGSMIPSAVPPPIRIQTDRPSVEPLTPMPGSPAVVLGQPSSAETKPPEVKAPAAVDTASGAQEPSKQEQIVPKTE